MVAFAESKLISVWEKTWNRSSPERALALLQLTANQDQDQLAHIPVGQRDRALIDFRRQLFGDQLSMIVQCKACNEQMELELTTQQILLGTPGSPSEALIFQHDGIEVHFRLPDSADLIVVAGLQENRTEALLARCIGHVSKDGITLQLGELSTTIIDGIIDAMERADPQANVEIPVTCLACSSQWNANFDIVGFLWNEVDAWAKRTLNEIHLLATAYGWTEQEILLLPSARRQLYVNMVRQ